MTVKYDVLGEGYNITRQADDYLAERMYALLQAEAGKKYLDVGCGTGNYTIALNQRGIQFTGIDPSEKMLSEARAKNSSIKWLKGRVEELPFNNETFDGVLASLTLHHWQDIDRGFSEIKRVLKPGALFVIFTSSPAQMSSYWLNHYFPELMKKSSAQMPSEAFVTKALVKNGFSVQNTEKYSVDHQLRDLFLQSGKYRPQLYLDPQVRSGISTFADLANAEEVEKGLEMLKQDIASGKIESIIEQYESDTGDYLFIVSRS